MTVDSLASQAGGGCIEDDELLRFVTGALDERRAADVRAHVDLCDDCRELLAVAGREMVSGDATRLRTPARADTAIRVGLEIAGRFRIDREIGRGGMGIVYAATDLSLHREVAIKILSEEMSIDEECVARFTRETRVAAKLASRHAVRVFDVGRLTTGQPYMVMELLAGQDLERIVRAEGALPVERALRYVTQACDALAEAHEAGIVHRDIKLANLFLTRDAQGEVVKVLDFGLAKGGRGASEVTLTKPQAVLGTPHYMSREQLLSAGNVDARADVWSLGMSLYRMLTGDFPFDADDVAAVCTWILRGSDPQRASSVQSDVPAAIDGVISRCLARDPLERFANARELRDALIASQAPATEKMKIAEACSDGEIIPMTERMPGRQSAAPPPPPARPSTPSAPQLAPRSEEPIVAATPAKQPGGGERSHATALALLAAAVVLVGILGTVVAARSGTTSAGATPTTTMTTTATATPGASAAASETAAASVVATPPPTGAAAVAATTSASASTSTSTTKKAAPKGSASSSERFYEKM